MTTTTNVAQVKLNIMTQEQYDNSLKSDTELYVITDASPIPIDDELSLLSENPVKNSVLTTRSNQIQTELNDKLSKSAVWNKLNKAYGWTYRHINGSGNAYLMYYTANGYSYADAISAQSVVEDETAKNTNDVGYYIICLNNQLYRKSFTTTGDVITFSLSPIGENKCTCYASVSTNNANYIAIINNDLYRYASNGSPALTLKDSGGWTKISYCSTSSTDYGFGIKNDNLYYVSNYGNTITLKDSGIWSDVVGYSSSSSFYGFGIKENKLYSLNNNGVRKISDETGWSMICGYDADYSISTNCGYGIRNGNLYKLKGFDVTLINDTETWIKIRGYGIYGLGLTQSGKIYKITSSSITQIGADTGWTDISGKYELKKLFGVKNGDVYVLNDATNMTFDKITNLGNIQKVYSTLYASSLYPTGFFWTGSVTEDVHSVYTVANPSVGFYTYSDINLQNVGTISAVSSAPYTITDQYYTYTRDTSLDGVFTGISPNNSNISMTIFDLLNCLID